MYGYKAGAAWVVVAALSAGCAVPSAPTAEARRASFDRLRSEVDGNPDEWKQRTYLVFSGGPEFRLAVNPDTGAIEFTGAADGFAMALGAGLTGEGHIVTAAHALGSATNVHVVGWLSGTRSCAPARVVLHHPGTGHADFALLKVDAAIRYFPELGPIPPPGVPVVAVVCQRGQGTLNLGIAGGRVLGVRKEVAAGGLSIIESDLPLVFGDSGGPLISARGALLGVNAGITYGLRKHWSDSVHLDPGLLRLVVGLR